MEIRTKLDMYARLLSGAFGPYQRTYSIDAALSWTIGYMPDETLFAVRYKLPDSPFMRYDIPAREVFDVVCDFIEAGAKEEHINITPMMPDERIILQGEIRRSHFGYDLRISFEKRPMRIALQNAVHLYSPVALLSIKHHFTPSSYDNLQALLEAYPDSVVEFSLYTHHVERGKNMMIWEVRNY